ncbi:MAG: DNA topoisomerase IB [Planctomycetota bacterium]
MSRQAESIPEVPSMLRYVTDDQPGITRRRCGRGFTYRLPDGRTLRDPVARERIDALAIPPAYERVWVCVRADGHLQATGRDAAGRKQYRYHAAYRRYRQRKKFDELIGFAEALGPLRRRVHEDLKLPGLPRRRVLAAAVRLMDLTLIRPGHGGESRGEPTFGLATLHERHLSDDGDTLELDFRGKGGRRQRRAIDAPAVARVLRRCQGLPGRELLRYLDEDDAPRSIDAGDVNDYLAEHAGPGVTSKVFRTWGGTVRAACELADTGRADRRPARDRQVVAAVKRTAAALGNRPATCRAYYIHPAVFDAFGAGTLAGYFDDVTRLRPRPAKTRLSAVEEAVLALLRNASA